MRSLQITLFVLANFIFISQASRDVHQLIWGSEPSVLDQFDPEKAKARSEKSADLLVNEYGTIKEQIRDLEKGKPGKEVQDLHVTNRELYQKERALQSEILERERKSREFRDMWFFATFGAGLIVLGTTIYRTRAAWSGLAILTTGFAIFEYWASPPLFRGASVEYHALLVSKTVLTFVALLGLYLVWRIMRVDLADSRTKPST
jgi:hypothetical protein